MTSIPPEFEAFMRSRVPPTPRPLDVQIFQEAANFHEGAQRSFENRIGADGRSSFLVSAGIVGLAFACELYMKAIYNRETGKTKTGHRLNVLFAALSQATQDAVEKNYMERRKGSSADLRKDILTFSNAFVEWRYIYEMKAGQIDVVGLAQLGSALYEVALTVNPDYPVFQYTHERHTAPLQGVPSFMRGG